MQHTFLHSCFEGWEIEFVEHAFGHNGVVGIPDGVEPEAVPVLVVSGKVFWTGEHFLALDAKGFGDGEASGEEGVFAEGFAGSWGLFVSDVLGRGVWMRDLRPQSGERRMLIVGARTIFRALDLCS